jgi:predicted dehydrogenase
VHCDKGWLDINFVSGAGRIRHADGTDEELPPLAGGNQPVGAEGGESTYPLEATAANLVDVITGKAPNGSPGEVGWRVVEMLDAAYRSAAQGGHAVSVDSLYD